MMKLIVVLTVFSLFFVTQFSNADNLESPSEASPIHVGGGEGSLKPEQCPNACDFRCSATSHKESCIFFCNYCCKKCLCVPSGTYGNRQECPCYDKIKTKEGGPKCP
ncbi:hypothetical protein Bca4012_062491 [Brassica carinata]